MVDARRGAGPRLVQGRLESGREVLEGALSLVDREVAALYERLGVELADGAVLLDLPVHDRLGVARVVALVVTMQSVADHVDDDVLVELLAERDGQAPYADTGLRIVAVDVEDGRLDHLRNVRRVDRRPRRCDRCREPELVVDHEMHRAAGSVTPQL